LEIFRKAVFYIAVILSLTLFLGVGDVGLLQVLPMVVLSILTGLSVFEKKKNLNVWIVVLSVLMIFINISIESLVDVVFWLLPLIAFMI